VVLVVVGGVAGVVDSVLVVSVKVSVFRVYGVRWVVERLVSVLVVI
jgi:hypothetical protein